jgi:outer membrane protein assembly factor BamE (lipoprotein component of BamABCDE complex)
MNLVPRLFPALVVLLALVGCVTDPGVRPSWTLSDADFRQLRPGMTTAEVEKSIGKPLLKTTFARLQEEVWDYNYLNAQLRMRSSVHFNLRGEMKYQTQELDQTYYGCGC